jgi:hypothetical protein
MRVRAAVVAAWLACGLVTHPAGQEPASATTFVGFEPVQALFA